MAARTDPRIPALYSLTQVAHQLERSKTWVTKLHQTGLLSGHRVGNILVFPATCVDPLVAARREGLPGWQLPAGAGAGGVVLPELLSTTEAADQLGLAQRNWPGTLYRRGQLPGREVGRTLVFAAETVTEIAEKRRVALHRYLDTN